MHRVSRNLAAVARVGALAQLPSARHVIVLLRLAYLGVTNAFAMLRLLPMTDRDKDAEILVGVRTFLPRCVRTNA